MFELVRFTPEDHPLYSLLVFNEKVMTMNMGRAFTAEEADFFFSAILGMNQTGGLVGYDKVLLSDSRDFVGMFGISENENGDLEIEYMLLPEYWGKGYGTRLVRKQTERIAKEVPGKRILAITDPYNFRSIKVLEKNGFVKVKNFINEDGEDACIYEKE